METKSNKTEQCRYAVTIVATWSCSKKKMQKLTDQRTDATRLPFSGNGLDCLVDLLEETGERHGLEYFSVEVEQ